LLFVVDVQSKRVKRRSKVEKERGNKMNNGLTDTVTEE
jgi:hypothetical protein